MTMDAGTRPQGISDPTPRDTALAFLTALVGVVATRLPVARPEAYDFDELGFLEFIKHETFPKFHTLFLAAGREVGHWTGVPYAGFLWLDMAVSALALVAVWWWLRALTSPKVAIAGTCVLAMAPVFWAYGAMAGNYNAIPLVGSILLGVACRGLDDRKRAWHPYLAAVVLALGAGYRQDIGTLWLPVFVVILLQHRWIRAIQAGLVFVAVNLAWFIPMLNEAGGWALYRQESSQFAYRSGYLNSYWHLGFVDAPLRYGVKEGMALLWTFGPGLFFAPIGVARLWHQPNGRKTLALLALSMAPAVGTHLLVHFGVPGYAFHNVPALLALIVLGLVPAIAPEPELAAERRGVVRLAMLSAILAACFLLYPTDYDRPGIRGDFDLAFARHTRVGLQTPTPYRDPATWRTENYSQHRTARTNKSVKQEIEEELGWKY
jgi:hypothetical protein